MCMSCMTEPQFPVNSNIWGGFGHQHLRTDILSMTTDFSTRTFCILHACAVISIDGNIIQGQSAQVKGKLHGHVVLLTNGPAGTD